MPIYEFACDRCRKVVQFFFRVPGDRVPETCPRCGGRGLRRVLSGFAVGRGGRGTPEKSEGGAGAPSGLDEDRLERAMGRLEGELDSVDEEDPRQMGRVLRRLMEEAGTDLGPEVDTAIRRLEAGEDPEKIDEDLGGGGGEYEKDETLYEE